MLMKRDKRRAQKLQKAEQEKQQIQQMQTMRNIEEARAKAAEDIAQQFTKANDSFRSDMDMDESRFDEVPEQEESVVI